MRGPRSNHRISQSLVCFILYWRFRATRYSPRTVYCKTKRLFHQFERWLKEPSYILREREAGRHTCRHTQTQLQTRCTDKYL
uniref:Uncharacterized protein n=1 Tax=Anguilla anguilla TaxID=7936 RepID=A0A0E9U039_ANGAN